MMDPVNAKATLRVLARGRREAIDPDTRRRAASEVAAHVVGLLRDRPAGVVAGYAAIGSEIDPWPALADLGQRGWMTALPVIVERTAPLQFRRWRQGEPLETRAWGIREPGPDAAIVVPDVLLVPLLAFDRCGHRLGYGGGYYDRTIAMLSAGRSLLTIGVAFAEQQVDAVPVLAYDIPLDHIVTPSGVVTLSGRA
jgi:5-formyltetrahydrofolate cyclo-ligase